MGNTVRVWYDQEGDYLEVLFAKRKGYFRETDSDAAMEKVVTKGNVIGFSILKVSALKGKKPLFSSVMVTERVTTRRSRRGPARRLRDCGASSGVSSMPHITATRQGKARRRSGDIPHVLDIHVQGYTSAGWTSPSPITRHQPGWI